MAAGLDPREFIRVHSGMPEHPKVEPLSDKAFRCLIEAWCLCRRARNDGRIPKQVWTKRWPAKARREVVAAGLAHIDADTGDALMHDWLDHQPSVAEMDRKRNARAEAGRKGGQRSGEARRVGSKQRSSGEANAEANASANASPESGHEEVTSDEILTHPGARNDVPADADPMHVSDAVETSGPAETVQNGEAIASDLLHQLPKHSGSKTEPEIEIEIDSGYVGRERYVSNAPAIGIEPPPKFHPEHPDGYVADCPECDAVHTARNAWLRAGIAATEPARYCRRHPEGSITPCRDCAAARERHAQWIAHRDRGAAAARSAEARRDAEIRRTAIAACDLCDSDGYRDGAVCDHDPGTVDRARRGIAAARIAACRLCDPNGHRADGTTCDHRPTPRTPAPEQDHHAD